jgi:hypothetical protein
MNISCRKLLLINSAFLGATAFGLVGFAERAGAQVALHSDPYFYDRHVTVSVDNGAVVLQGFVSSEWDLLDAIRIANKAAGDRRVIDDLSIKLGGAH